MTPRPSIGAARGTRALRLVPALVALALGACAAPGAQLPGAPGGVGIERADEAAADGLDAIAEASVGDVVPLPAGNALGVSEVRVLEAYRAASGRACRRVALPPAGLESRVVCRRADGRWSPTRELVRSSPVEALSRAEALAVATRFDVPSDTGPDDGARIASSAAGDMDVRFGTPAAPPRIASLSIVAPARRGRELDRDVLLPGGMIRTRLVAGETLSHVAARLLGTSHRWPIIADANGILDPTRLEIGTVLIVPPRDEARAERS